MSDPLLAAIDKRRAAMMAFLERIVNMDSPTEDKVLTDKVGDVLQEKAESLGMKCTLDRQTRFADNRVCRLIPLKASENLPRVLLIGHYDTVYGAGTVAERPFRIEDGKAFGPGVFDMKGGLTLGLFAIEALQDTLGEMPLPTTFIFNSDEEIGSPASRQVILDEAAKHDLALILEPGLCGPSLTIGRKGVGIFHLDIEEIEAHAGVEPEKGANAIVEAAHKTLAIQELQNLEVGTTVTPGVVIGGTKPYVVPGACRLTIDIRIVTAAERARVTEGLEAITARTFVPRTGSRLTGSFHRPPMEATEATIKYVELLKSVSRLVGFPLDQQSTGGASDGNLTAAAGIPTVDGLGPHGGRAHSADEYAEVESIAAKCKVLARFLATLGTAGKLA